MSLVTSRLRLFVALVRPPVLVLFALYAALGASGGGRAEDPLLLARILLPVTAFLLFSVACNDLADERIDRVNLAGDPRRPLVVGGGALRREMITAAAVGAPVALGGGFLLGVGPGVVLALGLAVSAGYSLHPVRLADRGALASLALPACYVATPYLVGRLATAPRVGGRELLFLAGLYVGFIGRILLKDFRDLRGDALFGKRTFLVRHGRVATCALSAVCWTLGTGLLLAGLPPATPEFVLASLLDCAAVLWLLLRLARETHPHREERLISAVAILGRGLLLLLLAHLAAPHLRYHGRPPEDAITLALLVLTLGQTHAILRHGPAVRRHVPTRYRDAAGPLKADRRGL
ncbi:UbiA family prenyltransferase [Phaeacidiphilus oryzae]|uniref:UbiA family prenyltransferase n=1 Tax=Phaeacidiphilus oryzae TaxID=348818 RepID=UPI0013785212|nr:UbiA family prenyltransferase [Phaeacidiphilus oryzae]